MRAIVFWCGTPGGFSLARGFRSWRRPLYFVVLARPLGTTQYGLLAGAIALVGIVSQYSSLGSGLLFLRYVSADNSNLRLYWGNVLMSVFLLGGLLVVGLSLGGRWLVGAATMYRCCFLLPSAIVCFSSSPVAPARSSKPSRR